MPGISDNNPNPPRSIQSKECEAFHLPFKGVTVLNVNELANAVKSVLLPGETLTVDIIQEGREVGQGVAYLDDGTMIVVEDGREKLNSRVTVTVTKVLQTAAGRMIFSRLGENEH